MRPIVLICSLLIVVTTVLAAQYLDLMVKDQKIVNSIAPTDQPTPTPDLINEQALFDLVQRFRVENNLTPYKKSDLLCQIANYRLKEIKLNFSHTGFFSLPHSFCPHGCSLGENLADKGYNSTTNEKKTLNQWLLSPEHAKNLKADYTHSCLKSDGRYTVQIFGYY